ASPIGFPEPDTDWCLAFAGRTGKIARPFPMLGGSNMRFGSLRKLVPGLLVSFSLTMPAMAATKDGSFSIRGFGAQSCGKIAEPLENDPRAAEAALAWLLGYVTAFNRVHQDTFDVSPIVDGADLLRMIVGTCKRTQEALVETVA